ncbi:DUF1992 domain-containing protein [Paenibacillus sp. J2TS4]|uniref:DnaJ family domain-containing protein n=1 Tax=Paenibacillus sp. J2TS4 TaxID=2807194 RepID=UPI001B11485F|nr:DUF1992 domain-containing protein [Paenibacillus sp. J2TS4]GIP36479.1 hypothetical protein J2TS4_56890 [Paenibacillus sp. J2TS4]
MFSWFKKNRKSGTSSAESADSNVNGKTADTRVNPAAAAGNTSIQERPGKTGDNVDIDTAPATANSEKEKDNVSAAESDNEEKAVRSRQFWNAGLSQNDWIGEIYREQLKKGAFDNLPGKGKPISIPTGDPFNHALKNANYLPGWLALQHEIRDQLHRLLSSNSDNEIGVEHELQVINEKIKKYNTMVPSNLLQKQKITQDNIKQQYELWV